MVASNFSILITTMVLMVVLDVFRCVIHSTSITVKLALYRMGCTIASGLGMVLHGNASFSSMGKKFNLNPKGKLLALQRKNLSKNWELS